MTQPNREPKSAESALCSDCPPVGYPTDETRCNPCPRRSPETEHVEPEGEDWIAAFNRIGGHVVLDESQKKGFRLGYQERCAETRPEGEVDALVAEAEIELAIRVGNYARQYADFERGDAEVAPRFYSRVVLDRLASALSSRRALSREGIARIIDPDAFDLLDDLRDNPPIDHRMDDAAGQPVVLERADDDARLFGNEFARADDALSKADAILSRVEGKNQ